MIYQNPETGLIRQQDLYIRTLEEQPAVCEERNKAQNLDSHNKSCIIIVTEPTTPLIFMRNSVGLFHLWGVLCINIQNKY